MNGERTDGRIRIDRNECAGAFGDIGTDLPLIVGMAIATGAPGGHLFLVFGFLQVLAALVFRMPMPVQPLKVVAALVITHGITIQVVTAAGLIVGLLMLGLTLTGALEGIARVVPKSVIRGMQLGLSINLALIAVSNYIPAEGLPGWVLAGISTMTVLLLGKSRRLPPAPIVLGLGAVFAFLYTPYGIHPLQPGAGGLLPPALPTLDLMWTALFLLALPQIPLSVGNAVLATNQTARDLFPDRPVSVRKIGLSYSFMNLLASALQGVPICHGSGGLAGHYAFGGRTGGSVLIYGLAFIAAGLMIMTGSSHILWLLPLPVLGVLLLFEGLTLMGLTRDIPRTEPGMLLMLGVAGAAVFLPYGFFAGMCIGTVLHWLCIDRSRRRVFLASGITTRAR